MKKTDIQEIEFKWSVYSTKDFQTFEKHAEKLGTHLTRLQRIKIHDYYLDTPNRFFGQARTSCRLRDQNGQWELTLKALSNLNKGLATRREKTISLRPRGSFAKALKYCQNKFLHPVLGKERLQTIFEIHNDRILRRLSLPQTTVAQACFDDVQIVSQKQVIPLREIELEFLKGDFKTFESFVKAITRSSSLKPAKISKVATALKAFSLRIPEPVPGVYLFSKYDLLSFAASQTLKKYFETLKIKEPLVRIGMDEDAVHDMRVSTRRLRAAIRVFQVVMPKQGSRIFKELVWLGHLLGPVRDLQVFLTSLSKYESLFSISDQRALRLYKNLIEEKIESAYKKLLSGLHSKRYASLKESLEVLNRYQSTNSIQKTKKSAQKLIDQGFKKVLKDSRNLHKDSSDKDLHYLRISIKKLRYTCEFFRPITLPKMDTLIRKLVELQDILGQMQDALTSIRMLSYPIFPKGHRDVPWTKVRKVLEKIIEIKLEEKKEARKNFFKKWKKFKDKKALEKVLRF